MYTDEEIHSNTTIDYILCGEILNPINTTVSNTAMIDPLTFQLTNVNTPTVMIEQYASLLAYKESKTLDHFSYDVDSFPDELFKAIKIMYPFMVHKELNSFNYFLIDKNNDNWMRIRESSTNHYRVTGAFSTIVVSEFNDLLNKFTKPFIKFGVNWLTADGSRYFIPVDKAHLPMEEMYPFLNEETLISYYQRFLDSNSNILLLIGEPGTGKTTFIKGLIDYAEKSAHLSYDPEMLKKDYIYCEFFNSDSLFFIVEDADNLLQPRSEGNEIMSKFLNLGDGLVSNKSKKLIFTTNLPSTDEIDPALIRSGRCFDIINFEKLSRTAAEKLALRIGMPLNQKENTISIADVFNVKTKTIKKKIIGFG